MGFLSSFVQLFVGGDRNVIVETAEVFRENAENAGVRGAAVQAQVLQQFAAEFAQPKKGLFDRIVDGINRLPRPLLALGTLALFVSAMRDPIWFASRMQGLALVPEPLWWLMGAIVSFYFGARHQIKGQEFQRSIAETMARTQDVANNIRALDALTHSTPESVAPPQAAAPASQTTQNAALKDWRESNGT